MPLWEASNRLCGKRLQALLPLLLESLERHGHLALDPEVREKLLTISSATIDRLLAPVRKTSPGCHPQATGAVCLEFPGTGLDRPSARGWNALTATERLNITAAM